MKKITLILSVLFVATACSDAILDIEEASIPKVAPKQNARLLPANPQISPEAQQVLDYIQQVADDNRILAGQQLRATRSSLYTSISEYQHVYDVVGKYPAVLGLDWYVQDQTIADANSMRENNVQMATEHWSQGGIVTFTWHQQYPGHLDEPYAWVKRQTTQSEFDNIISQGTPLYNLWQADVDQIAGYMQDLENAGVPVIFRPYHEMQGSWFWWCGKSPASYIQLWNNLYDRLVNYHGLNNLLWCWSPNKYVVNSYFPGNDKVDLTGVNIYSTNRADSRYISDYSILQGLTSKPSVLAENGLLPDVSVLDQTNYAWFLPWHSTWCDNIFYGLPPSNGPGNTPTELLDVYNHPKVITLDEVNMTGTSATPIKAEAEDLPVFDSAHPSVKTSPDMSSGKYSFISTCVIDDFIEYTVNIPTGGIFPVQIGVSEGPSRAQWQLSIDGTSQGNIFDAYDPAWKVTDLTLGSRSFTSGTHTFRFTIVGKNNQATGWNIGFDYIKIGARRSEAEQLDIYDSAHPSTKSSTAMSSGAYSFIGTCVLNDFIEYTINVPSTSSYSVKIVSSDGPSRAKWQGSLDGTLLGTPHDAYNSTWQTTELDLGAKTLSAGEHTLRFTIVGKNPNASGWNIGFDYFELLPGN